MVCPLHQHDADKNNSKMAPVDCCRSIFHDWNALLATVYCTLLWLWKLFMKFPWSRRRTVLCAMGVTQCTARRRSPSVKSTSTAGDICIHLITLLKLVEAPMRRIRRKSFVWMKLALPLAQKWSWRLLNCRKQEKNWHLSVDPGADGIILI